MSKAALERVFPEEEMKDGFTLVNLILPVPISHGQLVEIRQEN
jgi:hypothetical protein